VTDQTDRRTSLRRFTEHALAEPRVNLAPASADASFRSYWRAQEPASAGSEHPRTWIVMDAPPGKEDITAWLDVAERLNAADVHVPRILAHDTIQGFVLMEDLGTRTYLGELTDSNVEDLYADALDTLLRMQMHANVAGLPDYSRVRMVDEMELMPAWFLRRHLGHVPACETWDTIEHAFDLLAATAVRQPRAFVHRDFHSRNLIVTAARNPGVIDFQDAVSGPVTYDLVSLLRDCYIAWDDKRIEPWIETFRQRLQRADVIGPEADVTTFRRWFDLAGLQRHIKVLGIFCRLCYRDGKPDYLADLPLVWRYTISIARRYDELADFADVLERALGERDITAQCADESA